MKQCIDNLNTNPYFNVAAEEYLLKECEASFFMLWQNEPSVVLGRFQDVDSEVDLDTAMQHGINIVRRFSGGGTVYQDMGNINLTFIENGNELNFGKFANQIVDLLSQLGIKATINDRRALTIDELKISGSAQCIYKDRTLFHATLLYSTDLDLLTNVLEGNPDHIPMKRHVKSIKSPVTNLNKYLSDTMDISTFKHFVLNYFLKQDEKNKRYQFTPQDLDCIEAIMKKNKQK